MTPYRLPFADYAAIQAVNWSTLRELRDGSPLHYAHRLKTPREDCDTFRRGRAMHTAVLEPDRFPLDYVVWTGGRRYGKEWERFREAAGSRTILTEEQYRLCLGMRDAVRSHPAARDYLERGEAERVIEWTDEKTGIRCKARLDWVSESKPAIIDLKSTASVEAGRFARTVARYGYHSQLAFYESGYRAVTGESLPVVLVAVESAPPHDVGVFRVDAAGDAYDPLYAGWEECQELLGRLAECRRTGAWLGRYPHEQPLELPPWMFTADTDDDMGSGLDLLVHGHTERSDDDAL